MLQDKYASQSGINSRHKLATKITQKFDLKVLNARSLLKTLLGVVMQDGWDLLAGSGINKQSWVA
jgi:hypothetical protein